MVLSSNVATANGKMNDRKLAVRKIFVGLADSGKNVRGERLSLRVLPANPSCAAFRDDISSEGLVVAILQVIFYSVVLAAIFCFLVFVVFGWVCEDHKSALALASLLGLVLPLLVWECARSYRISEREGLAGLMELHGESVESSVREVTLGRKNDLEEGRKAPDPHDSGYTVETLLSGASLTTLNTSYQSIQEERISALVVDVDNSPFP